MIPYETECEQGSIRVICFRLLIIIIVKRYFIHHIQPCGSLRDMIEYYGSTLHDTYCSNKAFSWDLFFLFSWLLLAATLFDGAIAYQGYGVHCYTWP